MRVLIFAVVVVAIVATASDLVLTRFVGESSESAYTPSSARP